MGYGMRTTRAALCVAGGVSEGMHTGVRLAAFEYQLCLSRLCNMTLGNLPDFSMPWFSHPGNKGLIMVPTYCGCCKIQSDHAHEARSITALGI